MFSVYSFQLFKSLHSVAIQRNKTLVEKTLTVINSGHSGTSRRVLISRTTKTQQNFENQIWSWSGLFNVCNMYVYSTII